MHLMNTKVIHDGTALRVDFIGEGGEVVSVRMEDDPAGLDDDTAVNHAKVMMVQLTAFEGHSAINEYDAQSNGNFFEPDPVSVPDGEPLDQTTH